MDVKLKIDSRALDIVLSSLKPAAVQKVVRQALIKAAKEAKKISVDSIYEVYALKKKDISVYTRTRFPTYGNPESSLTVFANPINLSKFKPSQRAEGVAVRVRRSRGRELIPGAFLAKLKGNVHPAVRTHGMSTVARRYVKHPSARPTTRVSGSELPINKLVEDPISEIIRHSSGGIATKASEKAAKEMVERVDALLDGRRK